MKFIIVLAVTTLFTITAGTVLNNSKAKNSPDLISPAVAGINTSNTTNKTSDFAWQVFVNNYYGYKIKHPSDVKIKNSRNGDISLEKLPSIILKVTQNVLSEKDTIDTVIKNIIDSKNSELNENLILITDISPIALGSVTAQTFTSKENGKNISYYFIPQENNKYLIITNLSSDDSDADYILSEDIVYSLELLP